MAETDNDDKTEEPTQQKLDKAREKGDIVSAGRSAAREPVGAAGYDALAAAYSRALSKLSGYIAPALRDLPAAGR